MSSAEPPILIDARLRAMLLWEEPWLWSQDGGAEQWLQVLRLEFPRVGMLEHEDALSLAAHLARAGMLDDAATAQLMAAYLPVLPSAPAIWAAARRAARYMELSQEFGPNSSMSSVWCWRPHSTPVCSGSH